MSNENKSETLHDVPNEVWWVWGIQISGRPVGMSVFDKIQGIIAKYPKYFQWETLYNSIPKEVHEAYRIENNGGIDYRIMPLFDEIPEGKGIESVIREVEHGITTKGASEWTEQDFRDVFKQLEENEKRQHEEGLKRRQVWNKHYKKYRLEYRDGY